MASESTALGHLRVLDLTQSHGQYATRLLADLGADVIRVEPPGGGPARHAGPLAGEVDDGERSLAFVHFNTNKRSIVLDLSSTVDRETLLRQVGSADAVVEDFAPGYLAGLGLGYDELRNPNPGIVVTSITPFGQRGPWARWKGNDLTIQALSDWMSAVGDEGSLPCACPADPTAHLGGAHAALGTLLALQARTKNGRGQHVDVSLYAAMVASASSVPVGRYAAAAEIMRRFGSTTNAAGVNCYRCADGYVMMNIHFDHLWKRLVEWIDDPALSDPYWMTVEARNKNAELAESIIRRFAERTTVADFLDGARVRGLPVARVNTFAEAVKTP